MASKESPLGLRQTKGGFKLRGKITGTEKEKFFTEGVTKNKKQMRTVNFGAQINGGKTVYCRLMGMERDDVYFSKTEDSPDGGKKNIDTKKIPWSERLKFKEKDYKLIGVRLGILTDYDPKGNPYNVQKTLTEYDACKDISDYLEDGDSVFIKGNIEYSTYNGKHRMNFVPNQISRCQKPIDFDEEEFKETVKFGQEIVYMGSEKSGDKYVISAKIINYNSIEDAEFVINNADLYRTFIKYVKPYTMARVFGSIEVEVNKVEVVEEDGEYWGIPDPMKSPENPFKINLVIEGLEKASIETELYNKKAIESAIEKIKEKETVDKDFGDSGDNENWGEKPGKIDEDDDVDDLWD